MRSLSVCPVLGLLAAISAFAVQQQATVLTMSPASALVGPVTIYAYVTPTPGPPGVVPAGTVDFTVDGSAIPGCTGLAVGGGFAMCRTNFPQPSTYTVSTAYSGDANTAPSSASLQLVVMKLAPSVYLAYTPSALAYGDPFTIGALVLGLLGGPMPGGTVTI